MTIRKSDTRLYGIWENMRRRCNDPSHTNYERYGGRGITVCDEWDQFYWFEHWALANGYAANLTIDRINNDAGYSPGNCRWASYATQARNNSKTVMVEIDGRTQCLADWATEAKLPVRTVHQRYHLGWKGNALLLPVKDVVPAKKRNAVVVEIGSEVMSLSEWSRRTGIGFTTLHRRFHAGDREEHLIRSPEKRVRTRAEQDG